VACLALATVAAQADVAQARVVRHAPRQVRIGPAPRLPAGANLVAGVASVKRMRITVALKPRNARALQAYAQAVSDPTSGLYRQYLTPREFLGRFAPTAATVASVDRSLRVHGLIPERTSANGLSIPVEASGPAVEHAFSLSLARFRLSDGADVVLNTSAPAVDRRIAPAVQSVIGLSGLQHWTSPLKRLASSQVHRDGSAALSARGPTARIKRNVATGGPQPCHAATAAAPGQSAYTSDEIASAYGFSGLYEAGDQGSGQTIAVYELESDARSDVAAYQSCYGTKVPISYVRVDGGGGSGAGSGEAALDIEQLIGLAPGVRLIVYRGPNSNSDNPGSGPYDVFTKIIGQDRASVISNSWGECEPIEGPTDAAAENVLFEEAAAQGQTVVSAAGDEGVQDCYDGSAHGNTSIAVDDPASQPFVTGVGGTTMTAIGPPPTETVWDGALTDKGPLAYGLGAGGGGVSTLWGMPSYQLTAPPTLNVIEPAAQPQCHLAGGSCREVPDVSADADPASGYLIYFNGSDSMKRYPAGWQGTGGTSGAAPVWAALFALADAQPACAGAPIGFANPTLYNAAAQGQTTYFNDVTTGNNDLLNNVGTLYSAGPGYDMASGLGTPNAAALAPALCSLSLRVQNPGPQRILLGAAAGLQVRTVGPATAPQFSAKGLPSGLVIDRSTGIISGAPRRPGVFNVSVSVTDGTAAVGGAAFTWTVEGRPQVSDASLRQISGGKPVLALTVAAGQDAPDLRTITLSLPADLRLSRSLSAVSVSSAANQAVAHKLQGRRGKLTVTLRDAASRVRVVLGAGSVIPAGSLVTSIRQGQQATIGLDVESTDQSGLKTELPLALTPGR
jgi:subtilase family serine protease